MFSIRQDDPYIIFFMTTCFVFIGQLDNLNRPFQAQHGHYYPKQRENFEALRKSRTKFEP